MFAKNEKEIEGQPVRRTNQNISNSGIIEIWNRQRLSEVRKGDENICLNGSSPAIERLPADMIDRVYRLLRIRVLIGISVGYVAII